MNIRVEFSSDALWGNDPQATAGVDAGASEAAYVEKLTARLAQEYPGATVIVERGINDRHSVDGQTDTPTAADVGEIINQVWESWEWVVQAQNGSDNIDSLLNYGTPEQDAAVAAIAARGLAGYGTFEVGGVYVKWEGPGAYIVCDYEDSSTLYPITSHEAATHLQAIEPLALSVRYYSQRPTDASEIAR